MSLTIPSQVRGSDYSRVDETLEPRPSIWRLDATGYKLISVNYQEQKVSDTPRGLNDGEVLSFNFSLMLQMNIQAGDVLGFWMSEESRFWTRIEHLPLLFKPGSFTRIVIANFTATSDSLPSEPAPTDDEFKTFPEFESVAN